MRVLAGLAVLCLHEADDRVVDHLGGPGGHQAAAADRGVNLGLAPLADLREVAEPLQEGILPGGDDLLAGEETGRVLPVDGRDQARLPDPGSSHRPECSSPPRTRPYAHAMMPPVQW